jgi:hypothetical protein
VGKDCCFCTSGSGVIFFTATTALGPWTQHSQVGRDAQGKSITKAQQNFVIPVPDSTGGVTYVWTGDRWGSAPDKVKDHDFQTWLPLEFESQRATNDVGEPTRDTSPSPDLIKPMVWQDSFFLDVAITTER